MMKKPFIDSNRQQSTAINGNRRLSNRLLSTAIDGFRLLSIVTLALPALADGLDFADFTLASAEGAAVRLENRATNLTARAVVCGSEYKAAGTNTPTVAWNTATEPEGWQTLTASDAPELTARLLVRNDASIAVEGGRLQSNTVWGGDKTHLVRNWVVVPEGKTLTIAAGTTVKFGEQTGIKVEEGGTLNMTGTSANRIVMTALADDAFGGDTDQLATNSTYGGWSIAAVSGGTVNGSFTHVRYGTVGTLPTLSLPVSVTAQRSEGKARIPITFSAAKTSRCSLHWKATDGTAKYETDYTQNDGEAVWAESSGTTVYFEIPLNTASEDADIKNFVVELVSAEDINPNPSRLKTTVTIVSGKIGEGFVCAESASSDEVRLENRPEGFLGKALAHGVELKAAGPNTSAVTWNTTTEDDGWQTLTASDDASRQTQVLVRNDSSIAVEGGRLQSKAVEWSSEVTHLVRNWVVVPNGATLTITTNAVVKFCEATGIKVEDGGRLNLLGSLDENVYLTLANDDTVGGDTDSAADRPWDEAASNTTYSITVVSGGTFTDAHAVIRGMSVATFGTVSLSANAIVDKAAGTVRIPVFVAGTRTSVFSVDWKTSDGLAGQIVWNAASEGTKWIELDLNECSANFTVELVESRGVNIVLAAKVTAVKVYENATKTAVCAESESSAEVRLENREDGTFGRAVACGVEQKATNVGGPATDWNTTGEPEGWQTLTAGDDATRQAHVLVRNDASIAVEGGRLQSTAVVWSGNVTHVVRNWVVVPSGATLTIAAGTVVKFAEHTGFKIEPNGCLYVQGTVDAPVAYTSVADDTIGGDSDLREAVPQYGDYAINVVSGGTYSDNNCAIRYATFSNLGTASLPANVIASEKSGSVRIPVSISTDRAKTFCVDWRAKAGTAKEGTDYTLASGRITWGTYTEGTKYIEIPLVVDDEKEEMESFTVELYESQGINISTTALSCTVSVYDDTKLPEMVFAESEQTAETRLENRDADFSLGAALVTGVEAVSDEDGGNHRAWDTTATANDWLAFDGEGSPLMWLVNDPEIAIEGGRAGFGYDSFETNGQTVVWYRPCVWSNDVVHLVRNWVIVPSGATLTINPGTVVKFCDETGIYVEPGGRLVCNGTKAANVILTSVSDDTVGGDTDVMDDPPEYGNYSIHVVSSGTFTDTYTQMRYGESETFGSVSVANRVVAKKDAGWLRIPVTISSSRTTPFAVNWSTCDDTAVFGEDYLTASGRVEWASSGAGTQYIEIPLDRMAPTADGERFYLTLDVGLGINVNLDAAVCEVLLYDTCNTFTGDIRGYAESEWASLAEVDGMAGTTYPLFAKPEEAIRYSTLWTTNADDQATVKVTVEDMEGNVVDFVTAQGDVEDSKAWIPDAESYGRYHFKHVVTDGNGKQLEVQAQDFIVSDVVEHGGPILANETWDAGHVHVVRENVIVKRGATLTIEPGTIVKFFPSTGIATEGNGECVAYGVQFTHVADDQLGGDTFFDGGKTVPGLGEFTLAGTVITDESTETRYAVAKEVSANISVNTTWGSHTVYHITKSISIVKPATLTILPGAVVKLADGVRIAINSGATLDVQGTRASPVVITSIKDDSYGGDSNGDGTATEPTPSSWDEIANSGTMNLAYAEVLYGGRGDFSNQGDAAIRCNGGSATLYGCTVAGSNLRLLGRSGGTMTAYNTVLRDGRWGWDGDVLFVNGVVDDCSTGTSGGRAVNTIFRNCVTMASGTTLQNCLAWDCQGGTGTATVADPKFVTGEKGDYRLVTDSPCKDAGDAALAPEADYFGQPRCDAPDIGVYEIQARTVKSDIDLSVVSLSADAKATVGGNLKICWSVENLGTLSVETAWRDVFELIDANGTTVKLGSYTVTGGIVAGGKRVFTGNFRVPSASAGAARLRVKVNAERDVFEGAATDNNITYADATIDISIPSFTDDDYSTLTLVPGSSMALTLPSDSGVTALIIRSGADISASGAVGYVPVALRNDVTAIRQSDGSLLLTLPSTADESDFTFVVSNDGEGTETVTIETVEAALEVTEVTPSRLSNAGEGYLTLHGIALDAATEVRLVGNSTYEAATLDAVSSGELTVTLPLAGASTGTYALEVQDGDGNVSRLDSAVEIYKPKTGPKLEARLEIPGTVRQGRIYTGKIIYSNTGDSEMLSPCFELVVKDADVRLPEEEDWGSGGSLELVGISSTYPYGVLMSGSSSEIEFEFRAGARPSFSLLVDADPSSAWQEVAQQLSEAATVVNRRGRTVVRRSILEDFEETAAACGVLVDAITGGPLPGVELHAEDVNGVVLSHDIVDDDGVFVLAGLENGSNYVLKVFSGAEQRGYPIAIPVVGDLLDLRISSVAQTAVEFRFEGLDEEDYSANLVLSIQDRTFPVTNSILRVELDASQCSCYSCSLPNGECVSGTLSIVRDADNIFKVNFPFTGKMRGSVVDSEGAAISNAVVTLYSSSLGQQSVLTAEDGSFVVRQLPSDEYSIFAAKTGFGGRSISSVTFSNTEDLTLENALVLVRYPNSLSGRLPTRFSGHRVAMLTRGGEQFVSDAAVDANGEFRISHVPVGLCDIYVLDEQGSAVGEELDVLIGPGDNKVAIDIEEDSCFVKATACDVAGDSIPSTWIFDAPKGECAIKRSASDGMASLWLKAGAYWCTVMSDGYVARRIYCTITDNEALKVVLEKGGTLCVPASNTECDSDYHTVLCVSGTDIVEAERHLSGWVSPPIPAGRNASAVLVASNAVKFTTLVPINPGETSVVARVSSDRSLLIRDLGQTVKRIKIEHLDGSGLCLWFNLAGRTLRFDEYPAVKTRISAYASGGGLVSSQVVELDADVVTISAEVTIDVRGRVHAQGSTSCAGGLVSCCSADGAVVAWCEISADGSFAVRNVSTERFAVLWVRLSDGSVFSVPRHENDNAEYVIEIPALDVTVFTYVNDSGEPIQGLDVEIRNPNGYAYKTTTDSKGRVITRQQADTLIKAETPDGEIKEQVTHKTPLCPICGQFPCTCFTDVYLPKRCPVCGQYPCVCQDKQIDYDDHEIDDFDQTPIPQEEIPPLNTKRNDEGIELQRWHWYSISTDWYEYYHDIVMRLQGEYYGIHKDPDPNYETCRAKNCTYNKRIWKRYLIIRQLASEAVFDAEIELEQIQMISRVRRGQVTAGFLMIPLTAYAGAAAGTWAAAAGAGAGWAAAASIGASTLSMAAYQALETAVITHDYSGADVALDAFVNSLSEHYEGVDSLSETGSRVVGVGVSSAQWMMKGLDFEAEMNGYIEVFHNNLCVAQYLVEALRAAAATPYKECAAQDPIRITVQTNGSSEIAPYVPPSRDPNEMVGPLGTGENRYVKPGSTATYTVYFENAADAEAAALDIYVTNPLSPWLDWSTFRMGEVAFNNQIDHDLDGVQNGTSEVQQRDTAYYVKSSVALDKTKGSVRVELHIVDKTTKYGVPEDPYAGILPPNDETGCGEGHFTYSIKFRDDIPAGTVISNSANIVFDYNDPIETDPAWWNTVGDVRQLAVAMGDESETNLTLVVGEAFGALPTPTRKGYAFKGWFFGPSGTGGAVTAGTVVPSGLENIHADWEANEVNVWVDGVKDVRHYDDIAAYETLTSVANGYTNLVCTGWVGTGDVPTSGTSNAVSFVVSQESSLWWRYATNYWVSVAKDAGGSVVVRDAAGVAVANELWVAAGAVLTAEAVAAEGYAFARWVDRETELPCGVPGDGVLPIDVNRPRLLKAEFTNVVEEVSRRLFDPEAANGNVSGRGMTYNGFLGDETLAGTFTLVLKTPKKGTASSAATLTKVDAATGKKVKVTGSVDVNTGVGSDGLAGILVGAKGVSGTFGGQFVQGALDAAKAKDSAALAVMDGFNKKVYGLVSDDASGERAYLTVTFAAKGKAKVAGSFRGAKVSGSAQMSVGDTLCAVPFAWSKKGVSATFVLWFDRSTQALVDVTGLGAGATLVAAGSADAMAIDDYEFVMNEADIRAMVPDAIADTFAPISLSWNGKKFDAGKAAKVSYKKGELAVDTSKGGNVTGLSLKCSKGTLTGSFTIYAVANSKLVKDKFTVSGVIVGEKGYATATNKKLGSCPVLISHW